MEEIKKDFIDRFWVNDIDVGGNIIGRFNMLTKEYQKY